MTQGDAILIANQYILSQLGGPRQLIGARENAAEWVVSYQTELPGMPPGTVVDGPTVVIVDKVTRLAEFLRGM